MSVIRDSGYKQAPSGNVAVDFAWGNLPGQTNDDRSGSSIVYNATGGTSGSTQSDVQTAVVTAASASAGTVTYTSSNEFNAGEIVTVTGLSGSVAITGITASAGVVTYATASTTGLTAGQTIVVSGASTSGFNGTWTVLAVNAGTSFTVTSAATGSTSTATGTYVSAFNLSNVTIASVSSSQFTVTNAATDRAVTGATAVASVAVYELDGVGADVAWSTTTDYTSNVLVETQPTVNVGLNSYTVPADNNVRILNSYEAYPLYAANKTTGFNPGYTLQATITGATGNGTTVTYTGVNHFTTGQTVTITGLYNYVSAGSTQPVATQYYAPTYTTASAYNLSAVTIASIITTNGVQTGFTVTNSTVDSTAATLTSVNGSVAGTATVTVAASASTASVPTVTGLTIREAQRQLGVAGFNNGAVTYTTSGATANNAGTVYSQSLTSTQTLGAAVALVVYRLATGENPGTQAGTFTYTN